MRFDLLRVFLYLFRHAIGHDNRSDFEKIQHMEVGGALDNPFLSSSYSLEKVEIEHVPEAVGFRG